MHGSNTCGGYLWGRTFERATTAKVIVVKPTRGFWQAKQDLALERVFVVPPVERRHALAEDVEVLPVQMLQDATRQ